MGIKDREKNTTADVDGQTVVFHGRSSSRGVGIERVDTERQMEPVRTSKKTMERSMVPEDADIIAFNVQFVVFEIATPSIAEPEEYRNLRRTTHPVNMCVNDGTVYLYVLQVRDNDTSTACELALKSVFHEFVDITQDYDVEAKVGF